jgi:hypothetical protein
MRETRGNEEDEEQGDEDEELDRVVGVNLWHSTEEKSKFSVHQRNRQKV